MEDMMLDEIMKELNWKERIVLFVFKNICIKIYKKGIQKGINAIL